MFFFLLLFLLLFFFFKQKTAYEISACLVGSEMCIRDRGMAYATVCEKCGVGAVVEVNCETDFCAKSAPFVEFVKDICKVVLQDNPADVAALMECKYPGTELKVSEVLPEKVMSIGENLQIRRFKRFDKNTSVSYVHAGGKIGVLVNLEVEGGIDATTCLLYTSDAADE